MPILIVRSSLTPHDCVPQVFGAHTLHEDGQLDHVICTRRPCPWAGSRLTLVVPQIDVFSPRAHRQDVSGGQFKK